MSKKATAPASRVLLDSDDEDETGKKSGWSINTDYAKKYEDFRAKEELQKLKDKYGADAEEPETSSSESEDEDAEAITPQTERDFFKTLAILKSDDPRIYDKQQKYYEDSPEPSTLSSGKSGAEKSKPLFLREYERKILLEHKDGVVDGGKEETTPKFHGTYDQEQEEARRGLAALVKDEDDEDDDGLLVERKKSDAQLKKDEDDYTDWLRSQATEASGSGGKNEAMKPLKTFWSDPKLDEGEKFLRDYLLDKKYMDKDKSRLPSYGEIVEEDFSEEEEELEKADEFEQKYNFRFEEPDPDFIKRFPRTMADSLRRKDDSRKVKRDEVKERKDAEKERVKDDIRQLKSLKRREILQKLERLKAISGNEELDFGEMDIDGDFDPNSHDTLMSKVFSEDYYGGEEQERPDISDESDMDENYAEEKELEDADESEQVARDPQPSTSTQAEGKRKRRTKVSEAVRQSKPAFDPDNKKLEEYLEEYYKLDFEDVVAGIPCRFKYRSVVPNSFGLTTDEIIAAPDRELNAWCSLKKTVQHRSDEEEQYDVRVFKQKGALKDLKLRIIPSLADIEAAAEKMLAAAQSGVKKKKRRRKGKGKDRALRIAGGEVVEDVAEGNAEASLEDADQDGESEPGAQLEPTVHADTGSAIKKRRKKSRKSEASGTVVEGASHEREEPQQEVVAAATAKDGAAAAPGKKRRKRNKAQKPDGVTAGQNGQSNDGTGEPAVKKQKTKFSFDHEKFIKALPSTKISDERLKAYGLNPKKHRAKENEAATSSQRSGDLFSAKWRPLPSEVATSFQRSGDLFPMKWRPLPCEVATSTQRSGDLFPAKWRPLPSEAATSSVELLLALCDYFKERNNDAACY
ncbi:Protein KRI1-like protein [Hypsibius exemplaris]|uniref:Protein KRI1 homolog n=1 Tax=Hypsibius exemplaris TaxID=2072580 RepID=A0A1W0WCE5_HYPEX|nr:Protein KRI1-like protein [Hypsibius exemplaris]